MHTIPNLFFNINLDRNGPLCRKNFPELAIKYNDVSVLQRAAHLIKLMAYLALELTDN